MAWAILLYAFTALLGGFFIFYIFTKSKTSKRGSGSPLTRYNLARKTLPIGSKNGWKLIGIENGLRFWRNREFGIGSLYASSTILPVSLETVKNHFTDPSAIIQWDPWTKSVSTISVSSDNDSSAHPGDVLSVTVLSNSSYKVLDVFEFFVSLFKEDSKVLSRTWHYEESLKFWLHSAVIQPHLSDPVYTVLMAFPIKDMHDQCEVTIVCDGMFGFNPCSLPATLAGLRNYITCSQSEVTYPAIVEEKDSVVDEEDNELDEVSEETQGKSVEALCEGFVDVTGVFLRPEDDVQSKYKGAIDNAVKKLMECYHAKADENGWSFVGNIKNVEILKKPARPGFSIWDCSKGTIEVNVPIHYLLAYCRDLKTTSDYDDMFNNGHVIESLGELTDVVYLEYKAIWPVSGRDFCAFNAIRILPDNIYVTAARATKHPSCPQTKKYVRGKILIGGFVMKVLSEEPPRVMVTYVTHVDLAGSVPSRIVNKVTANQPQSVGLVKKHAEKLYREVLANPDSPSQFKEDAMDLLHKLKRAKNVMDNAKVAAKANETPTEESPQTTAVVAMNGEVRSAESQSRNQPTIRTSVSAPQFSPAIQVSSLDYVDGNYKAIGNQACAGLLQEVFEVADVDITKSLGSSGTVYERWEYRGTEKDVMIFRKIHANEKMHSFIGKGIIPCSPLRVWEVLKSPTQRYMYDNMLKETRILEKLSDTSMIEYLHFEAVNCFQKQARDFVILRTERKESDRYLMSYVSVDYSNPPPVKKDVRRGKITASGWVVEPMLHNGQLQALVTYLSQVNPGGSYPVTLINMVARKQPLCVAYLKRRLDNSDSSTPNSSQ